MKDFSKLEKKLGVVFKDKKLLKQAFIHKSYLNENRNFPLGHNERLEFLGDAVMELVVTRYLYLNYENPEGELTNWRSSLVKGETISKVGRNLGFNDYLYLSHGEAKATGKARDLILANNFEAVIGAMYLDQGYEACEDFLKKNLISLLPEIIKEGLYIDAKTAFQEAVQERVGVTPVYKVLDESGPDHARKFKVGAFVENKKVGEGEGASKQKAQEAAAQDAIQRNGWKKSK